VSEHHRGLGIQHHWVCSLNGSYYDVADHQSFIDWGFATRRPLQMACSLPRFLCMEEPILPPPLVLQEDRRIFIASLQSGPSTLAQQISLALSPDDIDFHQCFLESIKSKGMHRWLALQGWKIPWKGSTEHAPSAMVEDKKDSL